MKGVMGQVEKMGRLDNVWEEEQWTLEKVNSLWSKIWPRLRPYLKGKGKRQNRKSRDGQISYRSCWNNMYASGLFEKMSKSK